MKHALVGLLVCVAAGGVLGISALVGRAEGEPKNKQPAAAKSDHTEWIVKSLREMETIKPGMTRADLLKVFQEEGGLSTGLSRTYAYRMCPLIKVDVNFRAIGRAERDADGRVTLKEDDKDVIVKISKPYLAWQIMD